MSPIYCLEILFTDYFGHRNLGNRLLYRFDRLGDNLRRILLKIEGHRIVEISFCTMLLLKLERRFFPPIISNIRYIIINSIKLIRQILNYRIINNHLVLNHRLKPRKFWFLLTNAVPPRPIINTVPLPGIRLF
jgi:hypothetical protein